MGVLLLPFAFILAALSSRCKTTMVVSFHPNSRVKLVFWVAPCSFGFVDRCVTEQQHEQTTWAQVTHFPQRVEGSPTGSQDAAAQGTALLRRAVGLSTSWGRPCCSVTRHISEKPVHTDDDDDDDADANDDDDDDDDDDDGAYADANDGQDDDDEEEDAVVDDDDDEIATNSMVKGAL
eukprot:271682-Amphidinium_carterae.2